MPVARFARDAALFAACYVALDWASYIDPLGPFYITPWNPQPALALAWMLFGGLQHLPVVLVTVFAADLLVRHAPGGIFVSLVTSVVLAGGYAWIAWILRSLVRGLGLRSLRELTVFVATVVGGTALVGTAFIGVLRAAGLLGQVSLPDAWVRFWVGDAVGILVTMPLLLTVSDRERRTRLAAPRSRSLRMSIATISRPSASSAESASSRNQTEGASARSDANTTRCFSPPESCPGRRGSR